MHKTELQRIEDLEAAIKKIPTEEKIAEIVRGVILEIFKSLGKDTKAGIIALAVIIGSIAVIGGGLKWILGFIGFQYLKP